MKKNVNNSFFMIFLYSVSLLVLNFLCYTFLTSTVKDNYYSNKMRAFIREEADTMISAYPAIDDIKSEFESYNIEYVIFDISQAVIEDSSVTKLIGTTYDTDTSASTIHSIVKKSNEGFISKDEQPEPHNTLNTLVRDSGSKYYFVEPMNDDKYLICYLHQPQMIKYFEVGDQFAFLALIGTLAIIIPISVIFSASAKKQVNALKKYTQHIASQQFDAKVPRAFIFEFTEILDAVDGMGRAIKKNVESIEEKNEKLEKMVQEKARFEERQKAFISDVSHEIKTPISIIRGYAESLQMGIVDPGEQQEYYDIIINECDRMSGFVKQLSTLSRIENNKFGMNYSNFDVSELVRNIKEKFLKKCADENIDIDIETDIGKYIISSDKTAIENVLINYTQNAYKYCYKPGKITLRVMKEGKYIYIGVRNNGPQIPESAKNKIWDRFFKVDFARTRNEDSSGLGLSIVKATMEQLGMPYGMENTEDGVEFYIKIKKA